MRAHDTQTSNVAMLHPIRRLLLHLGKHVSDNLGVLAGDGAISVAVLGPHDGDEGELGPCEGVVEVVF